MPDRIRIAAVLGFALCVAACDRGPKRAPAIGEAFVGPHSLPIRTDVSPASKGVATLQHGERVEILQQRRRVVRVRTQRGDEGWVDERQLLSATEMAELRDLAALAKSLPSQGKVTTYSELNVHTQPARLAPSFIQLTEGGSAEMLLYRSVPRTDTKRQRLVPPIPKKPKKVAKKPAKEPKVPPPPMPKPPPLPADWLELSRTDLEEDEDDPPADSKAAPPPEVPVERWSLIRMPNGAAGWVLSRMVTMAIPDEVAQYAEGKRIVSYAPLGEVSVEGGKKSHWFWATASSGPFPYDYDSVRVFIFNTRRNRYETAYIDRNVRGFLPVLVRDIEWQGGKAPGFSLCVLNREDQRVRREYVFVENRVRSAGEQPCEAPAQQVQKTPGSVPLPVAPPAEPERKESLFQRLRQRARKVLGG